MCHVARVSNLKSIMKLGLMPGYLSGRSGVVEVQFSPAFPCGAALPPRTRARGRTLSRDYKSRSFLTAS
eukprot:5583858-Lingulodinium_polyedra.AAC.1